MWPNPQFPADLVIFTEKSLMENLIFLSSEESSHDEKKKKDLQVTNYLYSRKDI